jgi:NADH:ubiquinone oxidoreductase subunit 3 (subunit A)
MKKNTKELFDATVESVLGVTTDDITRANKKAIFDFTWDKIKDLIFDVKFYMLAFLFILIYISILSFFVYAAVTTSFIILKVILWLAVFVNTILGVITLLTYTKIISLFNRFRNHIIK